MFTIPHLPINRKNPEPISLVNSLTPRGLYWSEQSMMFVTLMRLAAFLLALSQSSICGSRGQRWADLFCLGFLVFFSCNT